MKAASFFVKFYHLSFSCIASTEDEKDGVFQRIRDKKRPFMLWSQFMTDLHDELFSRFKIKAIVS